jgi:hypothetical protein
MMRYSLRFLLAVAFLIGVFFGLRRMMLSGGPQSLIAFPGIPVVLTSLAAVIHAVGWPKRIIWAPLTGMLVGFLSAVASFFGSMPGWLPEEDLVTMAITHSLVGLFCGGVATVVYFELHPPRANE